MSPVDKPAESAVERYNALEWVPDGEMGFDPGGREVRDAADAALAEATQSELELCERVKGLKEDNERLQWMLAECIARGLMGGWHITDKDAFLEGLQARWVARLAAAEAALYYDEDGDTAQTWQTRAEVLEAKLAAAESEIARLARRVAELEARSEP